MNAKYKCGKRAVHGSSNLRFKKSDTNGLWM
jgi:hypothetical protein